MPLTEKQFDCINFIEQEWLIHGAIPSAARIAEKGLCTEESFNVWIKDEKFRRNIIARGITLEERNGVLTETQLTAANVVLDLTDNRSLKKKLADLKVPTQLWESWLVDPGFQNYLRQRAEGLLGNNVHAAHLALLDRVRSGDTSAIKLYYEITGRYNPNRGDSVDLAGLIMRVIEIIQRHVSNSEEVTAIAEDLITLASGVGIGVGSSQRPAIEASTI